MADRDELKQAVWPHIETIMTSPDGKAIADAANQIIALVEQSVAARLLDATFHREVNEALRGVVADGWLQQVFAAGLEHIGISTGEEPADG